MYAINTIPDWHRLAHPLDGYAIRTRYRKQYKQQPKKEGNKFGTHVQEFMYVTTTKDNMMLGDRYSDYSSK